MSLNVDSKIVLCTGQSSKILFVILILFYITNYPFAPIRRIGIIVRNHFKIYCVNVHTKYKLRKIIVKFLEPKFIKNWKTSLKEKGLKGFLKQYGWKVVAAVFLFYLIRDSILYIIIPYLVINNIITCQ